MRVVCKGVCAMACRVQTVVVTRICMFSAERALWCAFSVAVCTGRGVILPASLAFPPTVNAITTVLPEATDEKERTVRSVGPSLTTAGARKVQEVPS